MNFIKGRDELKKFGACLFWFLITFVFGFLVSYIFLKYKTKFDDSWCLSAVIAGVCFYILTLILNCSIKSIKAGVFETTSSRTNHNSANNYKIFSYGIEPYIRNKLNIILTTKSVEIVGQSQTIVQQVNDYDSVYRKIHNSESYHKCELKTYETLANRRFWNIFCPFIGTEILNMEEIEEIIQLSK